MTVFNTRLDYEVPINFQYPIRKPTFTKEIYKIAKNILAFLRDNQFAVGISLSSFLISKTIASSFDDVSVVSTTIDTLAVCQERLCTHWNDTIHREENEIIEKSNSSLSDISFRCNASDPEYKPFTSLNRCMRDWCKYATAGMTNATECFDPSKKIVHLWNKYCPKPQFNRLKNSQKIIFLENCFKNICNHYNKAYKQRGPLYSLCAPVELHNSIENLYKLVKRWKKEFTTKSEQEVAETALSITASSIGVISSGVSIIAAGIGCHVARVTMSSVSSVVPNVAFGLKSIVDGTLAYARRVSMAPTDLLSVSHLDRRISQVSGQVASLYQDANSIFSSPIVENDVIETNFNFWEEPEITNDLLDNVVESNHNSLQEAKEVEASYPGVLLESNNPLPGCLEEFVKTPSEIPPKFTMGKEGEVFYTTSVMRTHENGATSVRPLWKILLESWRKTP